MQCLETYSYGKGKEFVNWAVALTIPVIMGSRTEAR